MSQSPPRVPTRLPTLADVFPAELAVDAKDSTQFMPTPLPQAGLPNGFGFSCGGNMPTDGWEVQAEQPCVPPAYPVRFKPLENAACLLRPRRLGRQPSARRTMEGPRLDDPEEHPDHDARPELPDRSSEHAGHDPAGTGTEGNKGA